jgi:hypothetical protein
VLLLVLGVLLLTGSFTTLSGILQRWTPEFLVNKL